MWAHSLTHHPIFVGPAKNKTKQFTCSNTHPFIYCWANDQLAQSYAHSPNGRMDDWIKQSRFERGKGINNFILRKIFIVLINSQLTETICCVSCRWKNTNATNVKKPSIIRRTWCITSPLFTMEVTQGRNATFAIQLWPLKILPDTGLLIFPTNIIAPYAGLLLTTRQIWRGMLRNAVHK